MNIKIETPHKTVKTCFPWNSKEYATNSQIIWDSAHEVKAKIILLSSKTSGISARRQKNQSKY